MTARLAADKSELILCRKLFSVAKYSVAKGEAHAA